MLQTKLYRSPSPRAASFDGKPVPYEQVTATYAGFLLLMRWQSGFLLIKMELLT